jgi:hypothetical protein
MTSDTYFCHQCGAVFSKLGGGTMSIYKQRLEQHSTNRDFTRLLGVNQRERRDLSTLFAS